MLLKKSVDSFVFFCFKSSSKTCFFFQVILFSWYNYQNNYQRIIDKTMTKDDNKGLGPRIWRNCTKYNIFFIIRAATSLGLEPDKSKIRPRDSRPKVVNVKFPYFPTYMIVCAGKDWKLAYHDKINAKRARSLRF